MKRISANSLFILLLLIINLRGVFGYLLRFGEPATSPTYESIPLILFMLLWKVPICIIVAIVVCKMKKISVHNTAIYLLILVISLGCLIQESSFFIDGAARSMILYGFLFIVIVSNGSWIKISQINKAIGFMAVFGLLFLLYQIFQYYYFGILPTHSHENIHIRYGSFYNDSLVLGIMLPMFAGYFYNKYQSIISSVLISAIVFLVAILTGSATAIAIVFLYILWNLRKRYVLLLAFICSVLLLWIQLKDKILDILSYKSGSIAGHIAGLDYIKDIKIINLVGFRTLDKFAEIGYLSFLYNFGVFTLIIMLAFHIKVLLACRAILLERTASREMRVFAGAAEGLTISVLLANINLPPIVYPPVYLVVVIFSAIVIAYRSTYRMKKGGGSVRALVGSESLR